MTEREKIEREIILDILAESSKWRVSEDDNDVDCIRMEVMDRAKRLLLGTETIDENGYAQTHPAEPETLEPDDYKALEAAYLQEHLERAIEKKRKQSVEAKVGWKQRNVRVKVNGKTVWKPREQCRQVPRDNSHGGLPWMWKFVGENSATVAENLPTKDEQCEAMWAEHEQHK